MGPNLTRRRWLAADLAAAMAMAIACGRARAAGPGPSEDASVVDAQIESPGLGRSIPVRVRWPAARFGGGRPLVIFSHGLGGTMQGADRYGAAWVQAGIVVVHVQHTGSDRAALLASPRAAMAPEQLVNRVRDLQAVMDQVSPASTTTTAATATTGLDWARIDPRRIGVAGHSFGSRTTLALAGELFPMAPDLDLSDPRPRAFMALSPFAGAGSEEILRTRLRRLVRPVLCITGTEDGDVVGSGAIPQARAAVFEALPAGHKAGLVLKDADHFTFAGQELPAALGRRQRLAAVMALQEEHLSLLARISTDWWLAQLQDDREAAQRLLRPPIREDRGDRWSRG